MTEFNEISRHRYRTATRLVVCLSNNIDETRKEIIHQNHRSSPSNADEVCLESMSKNGSQHAALNLVKQLGMGTVSSFR